MVDVEELKFLPSPQPSSAAASASGGEGGSLLEKLRSGEVEEFEEAVDCLPFVIEKKLHEQPKLVQTMNHQQ
jgi:hypothetical protein